MRSKITILLELMNRMLIDKQLSVQDYVLASILCNQLTSQSLLYFLQQVTSSDVVILETYLKPKFIKKIDGGLIKNEIK
jgi:hypothetical protein